MMIFVIIVINSAAMKKIRFFGEFFLRLENTINQTPLHLQPQILLDVGNEDFLKSTQEQLHHLYTAYNWPHTSTMSAGKHHPSYWSERLDDYFVWHGNTFGTVITQDENFMK